MTTTCPKCGAASPPGVLSGVAQCTYCATTYTIGAPPAPAAPPPQVVVVHQPYGGMPPPGASPGFGAMPPPGPMGGFGAMPPPGPMGGFGAMPPPPMVHVQTRGGGGAALVIMMFVFGIIVVSLVGSGWFAWSVMRSVNTAVESATQGIPRPPAITSNATPTCDRAYRCCQAYAATVGTPALPLCQGPLNARSSPMGETVCQAQIGGWRSGLQAMSKTVPPDCQ